MELTVRVSVVDGVADVAAAAVAIGLAVAVERRSVSLIRTVTSTDELKLAYTASVACMKTVI